MPKKAHGRTAKQKPRARRTTATRTAAPATDEEFMPAAAAATTTAPTAAARPVANRTGPSPRPGAARRAPTITVNYAYLHHDLISLSILGPAMVVLLIIAYLIFHGA